MTSSPTREEVEAAATLLEEANGFTLLEKSKGIASMLRALLARAEAAERERDALRDEWNEIAAGITTEIPEVGALWPMVSEISGSLCAVRKIFRNEVEAHNRTEAERDAARAEAARLREAHNDLDAWATAEVARLKRLWTYMQEAAADPDADEAMTAAEWLAEFATAEQQTRAALAGEAGRG